MDKQKAKKHNILASVTLARYITENDIYGIISAIPSGIRQTIWMYLKIKAQLEDNEEIKIGLDIRKMSDENIGVALGHFTIQKSNDPEHQYPENQFSVHRLKDTFILGRKLPPLPELDAGYYEFIVYEITPDGYNVVLDTHKFEVIDKKD